MTPSRARVTQSLKAITYRKLRSVIIHQHSHSNSNSRFLFFFHIQQNSHCICSFACFWFKKELKAIIISMLSFIMIDFNTLSCSTWFVAILILPIPQSYNKLLWRYIDCMHHTRNVNIWFQFIGSPYCFHLSLMMKPFPHLMSLLLMFDVDIPILDMNCCFSLFSLRFFLFALLFMPFATIRYLECMLLCALLSCYAFWRASKFYDFLYEACVYRSWDKVLKMKNICFRKREDGELLWPRLEILFESFIFFSSLFMHLFMFLLLIEVLMKLTSSSNQKLHVHCIILT